MDKGFYKSVYDIVESIPPGKVTTYGAIAMSLGRPRAARLVGNALRNSSGVLPWYRVVCKDGKISDGFYEGQHLQRDLLEAEGVEFLENGCVNMKEFFWIS